MSFARKLKRAQAKARAEEIKKQHYGERFNLKTGEWEPVKLPRRIYQNRKVERHTKVVGGL